MNLRSVGSYNHSSISTKKQNTKEDTLYWLSKSPEERFIALEILRQRFYGYDPATKRLQRILEVVKRPSGYKPE